MPDTADAIVIGGGITGASVAFHLAAQGLRKVVLCERKALAAGATGQSAAFIQVVEQSEAEARITIASLPYYLNWSDLVGAGSCHFNRTGYLRLVPPALAEKAGAHADLVRGWGVEVQSLDAAEVAELAPYLETSDVAAGYFQPVAGRASATASTAGFAERAQQLGAEIRENTTARAVASDHGRVTGVLTDRGRIYAPVVVLATGAWGESLLAELGLQLPLIPARTQVAHFRWPADQQPIRFVNVSDQVNGSYFTWHGEDARSILIGLSADNRRPIDDLENVSPVGDPDYAAIARGRLAARLPAASRMETAKGWAGPVTVTPDRAAVIDEHPEISGLFYVVGCNGRGFKGAPAVGRALAEWAVDGEPRYVDLRPFTATRFQSGELYSRPVEYTTRGSEYEILQSQDGAGDAARTAP